MRGFLGIDLGSTTTKAVVLDEEGAIVGRGITNTRSNYVVATEVAKAEALDSARFTLLRRALPGALLDSGFDERFEARFRVAQHRRALESLVAETGAAISEARAESERARLAEAAEAIFSDLDTCADALFLAAAADRSRFFRDLVGSPFLALAEREARSRGLAFESLMGVYDKAILRVENRVSDLAFEEASSRAVEALARDGESISGSVAAAVRAATTEPVEIANMAGTGYGRQRLPFKKEQIRSEILCHGLGAHYFFPATATVLDIGGQDTKAIQVDEQGLVTSFQMNDRCAAGCGRYLGYIADELNLGLHELGPLSMKADRAVRITSTCTVFAGAELRDLMTAGEKRENILAGLHKAILLRAMSLLARSGGVRNELTFTGGVAKNVAVTKALRDLTDRHYGEHIRLNIHPDSIYTGAVGAALFASREA